MRISNFKILTFDTYGTLIDWETGIFEALESLAAKASASLSRDEVLEAFGRVETYLEAEHPSMVYSELLSALYPILGEEWGVAVTEDEAHAFGRSVKDWPAFADAPDALKYLKQHFKMATLTNCDRISYMGSNARLEIEWDAIYTAQDVGSYKPSPRNFDYLLEHVESDFGLGKTDILHVAQSLTHDHVPATGFGLAKAWIHRRHDKDGFGATVPPTGEYHIEFQFDSMAALVEAHKAEM